MPERRGKAWPTVLGALWLGLFPLWQDGSYGRITHAKWLAMLVLTALTAALLLPKVFRGRFRAHHGLALALLGWTGLSACFGGMAWLVNAEGQSVVWIGAVRYEGLLTQICYLSIFLLMSLFRADLRTVANAAAAGLLAYAGVVALQYAGWNPFGLFPVGLSVRTSPEFQGTIGNIDMVSGYVCLTATMLLTAFCLGKTGPLTLLAGETGVLLLLLMRVQSGLLTLGAAVLGWLVLAAVKPSSRYRCLTVLAGMAALVTVRLLLGLPWFDGTETVTFPYAFAAGKLLPAGIGLALLGLGWCFRRHPGRGVPLRGALVGAALLIALAVAAVALLPMPANTALWELRETLHGRPQDAFGSERWGIWRLTLAMSREHPLWGTGPDTFLYAMEDFMLRTGQKLTQRFDNPHSMPLALLANGGLPALILALALTASVAIRCLRSREPWAAALLAGWAAYLLQGLFTFSVCVVTPIFWAALGMSAACCEKGEKGKDDPHGDELRTAAALEEGRQTEPADSAGDRADRGAAGADRQHGVHADGQRRDELSDVDAV